MFLFENLTFDQALELYYDYERVGSSQAGNNIVVADRRLLENFGLLETHRFELKYIDGES